MPAEPFTSAGQALVGRAADYADGSVRGSVIVDEVRAQVRAIEAEALESVFARVIELLPDDWAGRRVTLEWADCAKHTGCQPELTAVAERLSDDSVIATGVGQSYQAAVEHLVAVLRDRALRSDR